MNGIWGIYLLSWLILLLLGYFLGCLNGSVMVSHFIIRDDVRQHGSGNAGLTNFYRTYGAKYALGVILFDMGKTVVACLLGGAMFNHLFGDWALGVLLGGLGCELGHMFPVFFGFKGGKGILSGGTLVWLLNWPPYPCPSPLGSSAARASSIRCWARSSPHWWSGATGTTSAVCSRGRSGNSTGTPAPTTRNNIQRQKGNFDL